LVDSQFGTIGNKFKRETHMTVNEQSICNRDHRTLSVTLYSYFC